MSGRKAFSSNCPACAARVIAKSFARIHRQNLINFGILPLKLANAADYDRLGQLHNLEIPGVAEARALLSSGQLDTPEAARRAAQSILDLGI